MRAGCPKEHCAAATKLWTPRRQIRHGQNISVFTVLYLSAVGVFISTNPGAHALQQGSSLPAVNISSSGLWTVSPSSSARALEPSPSAINSRTSSGTTPLSQPPDHTKGTIQPMQTSLSVNLDVVMSPVQLMPSPSGMEPGMITTDSLHATNALSSSAAAVIIVNSAKHNIITATTTVAAMTTRQSMFSNNLEVVSTTAAVQQNLLHTNSLMSELSATADNAATFNAFISTSILPNINLDAIVATVNVQQHAATSLLQRTQLPSVARGADILQTVHSMLVETTLQRASNSATISPDQSNYFQTQSISMGATSVPTLFFTQEQMTATIEPSTRSESFLFSATIPVHLIDPTASSLSAKIEQTSIHIAPSMSVSSSVPFPSEYVASTAQFHSEFTTIPTTIFSQVDQTTVYVNPSFPSTIEQTTLISNIFSSHIESTTVQSYLEYSTTVLVSASATPPLYISFYTSHSDVLLTNVLETEQIHSSTQDVYVTSELPTTKNTDQTLHSEVSYLTSSVDLGTVTETTTILVENSAAVTSTKYSNGLQGSSQPIPTAVVGTVTALDTSLSTLLPVTVTEFSTVMALSPSVKSFASNSNSALSDVYNSIISTTVLEETTLYLSPSVHFQAITPTLSNIPSYVTSTHFPGQPLPIPTQSMLPHTGASFLEPSSDVISSDVFVTSTALETTTMLPLTSELTSMLTMLYSTGPNSLPLTTKQLHVTLMPSASSAVQFVNSSSHSYQSTGLDPSLSSNVEIISSQYASSSIANETSAFTISLPLPVTSSLARPSLQSSSNVMSSVQQQTSSVSLLETGSSVTEPFVVATTMFMPTTATSFAINPSPSWNKFDSTVTIEPTETINRTNSYILPTVLSSKSMESSTIPTLFLSTSAMSSSPTPSLTPSVVSSIPPHLLVQSTTLTRAVPPLSTASPSVMTDFSLDTSSLQQDVVISSLPPDVDKSSDLPTFVLTPTPSLTMSITTQLPPQPPNVATSSDVLVLLPTPTSTPMSVVRPTETTLETSFVTKPYWVAFDISLVTQPTSFDPMSTNFVREIEENLARAYISGRTEKDERQQEIQDLLNNLDPDKDPLLSKRRRRAVTVDGVTAQVIDISRSASNSPDAKMVFYVEDGGVKVPAEECQDIMNELDDTELTHFLGVVVKGGATVYEADTQGTTTPAPGDSNPYLVWFIPLIIVIAICLFFCCCCWFYCFCCRVPPNSRKEADGPMDPETLKMLKFKSKYPYRPYDTPNQTPRGFDVAKEGLGNPALNMEDESKKANGTVETTTKDDAKRNLPKIPKKKEGVPYGPVRESSSQSSDTDSSPYLTTRSIRAPLDKDNLLKNDSDGSSRLASRSMSPGSSANLPPKKLPKTDLSQKARHNQEKLNKKQQRQRNTRSEPSPNAEDTEEFRRVYIEAQKEISKILEPELFIEGAPPPKGKRRRSSRSKRFPTSSSSDAEYETQFSSNQVSGLPETHLSRKPISPPKRRRRRWSWKESTLERQESLQDARRRVHALIDEAFSLVSFGGNPRGNSVSPAPPENGVNDERDAAKLPQNAKARGRRHNQRPLVASPPIHEEEEPPLFERTRQQHHKGQTPAQDAKQGGTDTQEPSTRVLIVPVNHVPDRTANNVVWNPYQAEDDLARLNESQQLTFVPGMTPSPKVPPKPKRRKSPTAAINQVLPPLSNLPETSLPQSKHKHHRLNIANKHSPDGASTESETGSSSDRRGRHHDRNQNRTRHTGADTPSSRTSPYEALSKPNRAPPETDLLSTIAKEQRLGKPVGKDYDELDVTGVLNSSAGKSRGLVSAVKEELMRMNRKGGDGQDVNGREIGPI